MREWCNTKPGEELLVVVCWTTFERDEVAVDWQGPYIFLIIMFVITYQDIVNRRL